jgi:acid phosphatase
MTCLRIREKLPKSISHDEFKIVTSHSAWKWFENLRNDDLARLAMKPFMNFIMGTLRDGRNGSSDDPILYIYSCHDSSLIGLMCAFRLEQPAEWPEYGSFLKVELFKTEEDVGGGEEGEDVDTQVMYYVRFSLNGEVLKSSWGVADIDETDVDPNSGMICLKQLSSSIARAHGHECILQESS